VIKYLGRIFDKDLSQSEYGSKDMVDESELDNQLTPMGTIVEGD